MRRRSRFLALAVLPLSVVAMSGCVTFEAAFPSLSATPTPTGKSASADLNYEPATIDNCGFEVTFDRARSASVTIKSTLDRDAPGPLGLGDRIVGTAFSDGPVPGVWAKDLDAPELSDNVPSEEVVLETEPDLVYAGWESNFSADGAGTRETWPTSGSPPTSPRPPAAASSPRS